jgi:ABC-2 type transport system permease protein
MQTAIDTQVRPKGLPQFSLRLLRKVVGRHRAHYLSLVSMLVRRELKVRYRGSVLGYFWSMLNPLLFMLVITFVFSHFLKGVENYNLYVLSGILMWNATSAALTVGTQSIVSNAGLLKKVRLPVWIFPMVSVCSSLTNFALAMIPYIIFFAFVAARLPNQLELLPIVLLTFFFFLFGLTLILSSLNVFFRDVGHVLEPVMMIAFYATPIIYDRKQGPIPDPVKALLELNPFAHFADAFRASLSVHAYLDVQQVLVLFGLAGVSLATGIFVYKRSVNKMIFAL